MSGMFDKKTEKEKRKRELTKKQEESKKKSRIITVLVTALFLLLFIAATIINSEWIRRTVKVVTIDGIGFSTAQFEYFFNAEYMRLSSEYQAQGLSYMLPDPNRSLSKQDYNPITGESWADLITDMAFIRMKDTVAVYKAAQAAGYTLSEESLNAIEEDLLMNEIQAQIYGYPTLKSYLQRVYGSGMDEATYREILEMVYIVEDYVIFYRDSLTYTDEELSLLYAEKADFIDVFKYRMMLIEMEEPEEIGDDIEAAYELSKTLAREKAEEYKSGIETEEDFIETAKQYNEYYYGNPDYTLIETRGVNMTEYNSIDFYFSQWLIKEERAYGDIDIIDTHEGSAIVFFISRDDNSYRTLSMRQILLMRENVSASDFPEYEDDPDYIAALEAADFEARTRAELADSLFRSAGSSEQALIDLMEEHSDDTTEGGYYENIAKFQYQGSNYSAFRLVPEIEEWLFDDERKIGDAELIESEAYGYHLVYFTGYGDVFAHAIAADIQRMEDTNQWINDLSDAIPEPVKHIAFTLVTT